MMNPIYKLIMALTIATLTFAWPQPTTAGADCNPRDPQVLQSIELAPAIAEQASIGEGNREFYRNQVDVNYTPGQRVVLASTADGLGHLRTDDLLQIRIGEGNNAPAWTYDFRSADRAAITSLAPVNLTSLFPTHSGRVTVHISLTDVTGPRFSSRPIYLLMFQSCAPTATASPTATLSPTFTETPLPSPTMMLTPTDTATPVPPTATETMTAVPTATPLPPTATATATVTPTVQHVALMALPNVSPTPQFEIRQLQVNTSTFWILIAVFGLALVGLAGIGVWLISQFIAWLTQPAWSGEIVVWLEQTQQGTYKLSEFSQDKITIGRFAEIALPNLGQTTPVAWLVRKRDGLYLQKLSPYPPQQIVEEFPLREGDRHPFGAYGMEYREDVEETTNQQMNPEGAQLI